METNRVAVLVDTVSSYTAHTALSPLSGKLAASEFVRERPGTSPNTSAQMHRRYWRALRSNASALLANTCVNISTYPVSTCANVSASLASAPLKCIGVTGEHLCKYIHMSSEHLCKCDGESGQWNPRIFLITENLRAIYLSLEKLIEAEETQVNGIVILADYEGVGLSQASQFGPFVAKKIIGILQDGFPIRIKAVNIINEPKIFKGIYAILRPFLKEKIVKRIFLHGSDLSSLHTNIPKAVLPEEYGGTAGKLDISAWSQILLASENDFAQDFHQGDLARDGSLQGLVLNDAESDYLQCEESARGVKSQLYCY